MNERKIFIPSSQLRERSEAAKPYHAKPAAKATQEAKPRADDELSDEELEFAASLRADPREGTATVRDNGVIVCAKGNWIGPRIWEK